MLKLCSYHDNINRGPPPNVRMIITHASTACVAWHYEVDFF